MKTIYKYLIAFGAFLCVLLMCFVGGCMHGRKTVKVPQIVSNTVYVHDTVTHVIPGVPPGLIILHDSTVVRDTVFKNVDTAQILRNFYSLNYLTQIWKDSLLSATNEIAISENQILDSKFSYKILRPSVIINNSVDNSTHFNKYLYLGLGVPVNDLHYANAELIFAYQQGYFGAGYCPQLKSFTLSAGFKLFRLK